MSVLIKGIEMPDKGHYKALFNVNGEGSLTLSVTVGNVTTTYDLVEIPTPHGRLIDADELIERIERFRDIHNYYPADIDATMRWFINQICGAKTIIEAENSSAIDDDVKKYCDYLKSETYDFCNRIENGEVSE